MDDLALAASPDGVTIPVRVAPRAGRTALDGVVEGALRVRLAAPPVEGAANRALVEFLANLLGVPKRHVAIVRGERGRQKLVQVRGLDADQVRQRLAAQV
jgi:uncharacterized protein (TIGR00251 family)